MSSSNDRCDVLGQAPSGSNERKTQLRFLDFPAEIRVQIYKYLLETNYVTEREANPSFFVNQPHGRLDVHRERESIRLPNAVRCQNVWIERSSYSLSILRVNRQLYQESSKIFSDNSWIFVNVNRVFFAQNLKNRGFNAFHVNSSLGIKISILNLFIKFSPIDKSEKSDNFLMSVADAGKLRRALSTSPGLETAKLTFIAGQNFPKESNPITEAFTGLWSVGTASVCGPGDGHSLGRLARRISFKWILPSLRIELVTAVMLPLLQQSLAWVQQSLAWVQAQHVWNNWREVASECEASILLVIDCHAIYPCLSSTLREDIDPRFASEPDEILEIYAKLLLLLIEAQFSMGDYEAVRMFSLHALGRYGPLDNAIPKSFFGRASIELDQRLEIEDSSAEESE